MYLHLPDEKVRDVLIQSGILQPSELQAAQEEASRFERSLVDTLVARGSITEDYFAELLSPLIGVPIIDLERVELDPGIVEAVPEDYAKNNGLLVFGYDQHRGIAQVAMLDPLDYDAIEYLRAKLNAWVEPYLTTPSSLRYGLRIYKEHEMGDDFETAITRSVDELMAEFGKEDPGIRYSQVRRLASRGAVKAVPESCSAYRP